MAEQNPDVLEVLISQIRENGDIDAVFSKRPAYSDNPSEACHSVIVTTDFPLRLYCAAKI
jgi:hypothetical protein